MRVYNKRVGFLVSYQTLIPHGGIGQFAKSFCDLMDQYNIKVDIITDKEPEHTDFIKSIKANIIYPNDSLPYSDHSLIFMYGDTFCYERMVNFRNSIIKALNKNVYDVFVCNTYESVQVASTMGLEDVIQIIAYTHLESQIFKDTKNPFLRNANELMRQQLLVNGVTIGTQSTFNRIQFESAYHLPIPLTEKELLKEHDKSREGVLFIGRWEEGKNPETFLELIQQTKLPAKVLTNNNGAKKFEKELKQLNVKYDIKVGLIGREKVDFITSSRIAFNPSTVESYGMAFYEQIIQLPTLVLDNQRWTQNFVGSKFFVVSKRNMSESALSLYDEFVTAKDYYKFSPLTYYQQQEESVFHKWNECFNEFTPRFSNSSKAHICNITTVSVKEYIRRLERKVICIDDVHSILTNKNKFRVIYTDHDTYLTKDPSFEPKEDNTGISLFEGI